MMSSNDAKKKIMDLLARRDHSELELREKLGIQFAKEQIEDALEFARQNRWLLSPDVLAEKVSESLHRKNKGIKYISNYLKKKGLPTTLGDPEQELVKALELAKQKMKSLNKNYDNEDLSCDLDQGRLSRDIREKVGRFLLARGFDSSTVRKVIYEKL